MLLNLQYKTQLTQSPTAKTYPDHNASDAEKTCFRKGGNVHQHPEGLICVSAMANDVEHFSCVDWYC